MQNACEAFATAAVRGVAIIALWAPVAFAHHSPAGYDMQAQRTIEGTVTEYDWGNPHVYLSVRENGSDQVWVVEAFASTAMKSYGWSPQTLVAGDRVVVVGNPGRNPDRTILFLRTVRKAAADAPLFDAAVALAPVTRAAAASVRANGLAGNLVDARGAGVRRIDPAGSVSAHDPAGCGCRSPRSETPRARPRSACRSRRRCIWCCPVFAASKCGPTP